MSYFHINTTGNFLIQTGTTVLKQIVANQTGDADWVVKIYDGVDATGKVVGICDANNGGNYEYGCTLTKGLYVVTSFTSTGTNPGDITVIFG
jgi:hypothetical protein